MSSPYYSAVIGAVLLAFPALALVHQSAPGAALHVLAALGLIRLLVLARRQPGRTLLRRFWSEYGVLCLVFVAPLGLNVLSTVSAGNPADAFPITVQRLALTGMALLALQGVPEARMRFFQCGVIAAAFGSSIILYVASEGGSIRPIVDAQNLLNYTNFVVLLGAYCLYMLEWPLSRHRVAESSIKILAFLSVIWSVSLSDSRGPLIALGVLVAMVALFQLRRVPMRQRLLICVGAAVVVVAAAMFQSDHLLKRLEGAADTTMDSLPALIQGEPPVGRDDSMRIRLALWQASWLMFRDHPWIGDGSRSYAEKLIELNRSGRISDEATWKIPREEAYSQAHNELAMALAHRGLAGGVVLLFLYGTPLFLFVRRSRQADPRRKLAAKMGSATVVGAILFGATVSIFTSGWMTALYVLLVAIFLWLSAANAAPDPAERAPLPGIPGLLAQKALRRVYRLFHAKRSRHNVHVWPYVKVRRETAGRIGHIEIFGNSVPLISVEQAFAGAGTDLHIILSGGSIAAIDYGRLPDLRYMGVNGSIALEDRHNVRFDYYCVIDRSFARTQRNTMRRIAGEDLVFLVSPDVLRYLLEYVPLSDVRCRFCLIEDISERAHIPRITPGELRALQESGRDIKVFDACIPLGLSLDPDLGWFDADTVAYTALQAAAWGGMRRIFFHGLDIRGAQTAGRFYENAGIGPETRLESNFTTFIEPSFRGAVRALAKRGIQVYNLSPVSALGPDIMPYLDWRALYTDPAFIAPPRQSRRSRP